MLSFLGLLQVIRTWKGHRGLSLTFHDLVLGLASLLPFWSARNKLRIIYLEDKKKTGPKNLEVVYKVLAHRLYLSIGKFSKKLPSPNMT